MRFFLIFVLLSNLCVAQQRPNIIYIMSDDHDADAISAYNKKFISTPNLDRLAKEGMKFERCFVGNSICGPARATLLTGQHSHKNGVKDNQTRFDSSKITLPALLGQVGYQTAIIGKWHLHSYPRGFDDWLILPGQGLYYDPRLIRETGDTVVYRGYATDVITNEGINWLSKRDQSKPFALFLHHKAPHRQFLPSLKYARIFHQKNFPEPASLYLEPEGHVTAWKMQTMSILKDMLLSADLKVDPKYLEDIPHLKPKKDDINTYHALMNRIPEPDRAEMKALYDERGKILARDRPSGKALLKLKYQWYMQDFMACVASIDENIGKLLQYLDQNGLASNTVVMYTSDQGFFLGENGWFDKRFMYDVSMQTPLLVRWPGTVKPNSSNSILVQNIDFAPTILDMAGVTIPSWMQGRSIKPLLNGSSRNLNRPYLYYHYYEYGRDHTVIPHLGVRTADHKIIYYYTVNEWELFDLKKDPSELNNLANQKQHQELLKKMKALLLKARTEYDDTEPAGELGKN